MTQKAYTARNLLLFVTFAMAFAAPPVWSQVANGFDLTDSLIPAREIKGGGPPRDGIRALTDPPLQSAATASWLDEEDRVIGVYLDGHAVAYPMQILNWHEVVNAVVGGRPITVTYCPLCGTGIVFDATIGGRRVIFGVSGLLYQSDVLLYDRFSESLVSQLMMQAVTGPLRGTKLTAIPVAHTTWEAWVKRHPETMVLSPALPYGLNYGIDPYKFYHHSGTTMFRVRGANKSHRPKTWAYLLLGPDEEWIVTEKLLGNAAGRYVGHFRLGDRIELIFDPELQELRAGESWAVIPGYWFALTAFYPDAQIVLADDLVSTENSALPEVARP